MSVTPDEPSGGAPTPRSSRLPRLVLRLASLLVPRSCRRRWLDEWHAELWALESDASRTAPTPLALSLGAVPHSMWKRKEWATGLLLQDVRLAARTLTRSPAFTALALVTMALGIGANITIFSMTNATLLRAPDGIDDPSRIVQIGRDRPGRGFDVMAYPWFRDFDRQAAGLAGLAAYTPNALLVGRGADTVVLNGYLVTGGYFEVLGVDARPGRALVPGDDELIGAHPVAVISHGLWTRRYGNDPEVVGRRLHINTTEFEIVGVAERGFQGSDVISSATDIWIPLSMASTVLGPTYSGHDDRGFSWLRMVGRLAPGESAAGLAAELNALYAPAFEALWEQAPDHRIGVVEGIGLLPAERTTVRRLMTTLTGVVALVLAVACANLANLFLARGVARSRELGIRTALGASRVRIVRELLTESVLLALGGGLLALVFTGWTAGMIQQLIPIRLAVSVRPDAPVFLFALGVSLLAGVVFGMAPALRSSRVNLGDTLRESSLLTGRRGGWLRGGLVVGQLALSFALLAVTGLLVQSLIRANATDPGYNTTDVLTLTVDVDLAGFEESRGRRLFTDLAIRSAALPGVQAAAVGSNLPFGGWSRQSVYFPRPRPEGERPFHEIDRAVVDDGYLATLQIPLLSGESFHSGNSGPDMPRAVLVSESAARLFWPGEEAVGKLLPLTERRTEAESLRVIGVVGDVQVRSLREPPNPSIYLPTSQNYEARMTLFLRTADAPGLLARPVQALVQELSPDLGILQSGPLQERMGRSLRETLTVAQLGGIFGILAAVLAGVGLYGVVSYVASSRSHEVGVRMALGARRSEIVGVFVRQAVVFAAAGIALGAVLTLGAGRVLAGFLFGVSGGDPGTLGLISLAVLSLAVVAALVPALRASRVDPTVALRRS